jgi:hypothetical protein
MRKYANNVYSQNGEDGILEEILKRLKIEKGICCEFGAADGKWFSNTFNLVEKKRWSAVYIESDEEQFKKLEENTKDYNVWCFNSIITDNLNAVLTHSEIVKILSIDVDGIDYHIWKAFDLYKPEIVIIEVNSSVPPPMEQIHDETHQGTSFTSMLKLGNEKGYDLVCHTGNMIFVRKDLIGDKFNDVELNSDSLFESKFVGH